MPSYLGHALLVPFIPWVRTLVIRFSKVFQIVTLTFSPQKLACPFLIIKGPIIVLSGLTNNRTHNFSLRFSYSTWHRCPDIPFFASFTATKHLVISLLISTMPVSIPLLVIFSFPNFVLKTGLLPVLTVLSFYPFPILDPVLTSLVAAGFY